MEKYLINPYQKMSKINKDIYGHFSEHLGRCIYEGIYVGEDSKIPNVNGMRCDVVNALKEMGIPVLRWPGGCFADEYHWKDGIGDKAKRKRMVNTHWGGVVEDNSFGTHEFFELCRQLGCDAYINGNVGSGTVAEMNEWIEYMTFDGDSPMARLRAENGHKEPWRLKYFGVGNESWGCGGSMQAQYYSDLFRRYNTYVRDYDPNHKILRVACGPNAEDYNWTDVLMKNAGNKANGISLHYYTVPTGNWDQKGSSTNFNAEEYFSTVAKAYKMDSIISRHCSIMDKYDPEKRVGLVVDEWGTWYDVEPGTNPGFLYQLSTMRDAVVAALTLNIFNKHADRVRMANIAQTVNVLQSVALTDGEDMVLTPTYYVFKMFKAHQNNTLLGSYITTPQRTLNSETVPQLVESASVDENGAICSTIVNSCPEHSARIDCEIAHSAVHSVEATILSGDIHDGNTFESKDCVAEKKFTNLTVCKNGFQAELPPCSVVKFVIR